MRVLLLGPMPPHPGGITRYTEDLARGLTDNGAEVAFLSYYAMFPKLLYKGAEAVRAKPTRVKHLHYAKPWTWNPVAALNNVDVLHIQSWTGLLAPSMARVARAAKRRGIPVVVTLHNVEPHDRMQKILQPLTAHLLASADAVIVHTQGNRRRLLELQPILEGCVQVVPHGIVAPREKVPSRAAARTQIGIPADCTLLLFLGMIRPYKGLDVALAALARLPPQYHLAIAGHPWEDFSKYQEQIDKLGLGARVHLELQYLETARATAYFAAANLALYPYKNFAAQSGALLWALGHKVPIVATREAAQDLHIDGIEVIASAEPEQLALAIKRHNLAKPDAAHDWRSVGKLTLELYRGLR